MKKKHIVKRPPSLVHSFRCTDAEWKRLNELAEKCGISIGRYLVECGLKHHPRQRLTKEETNALNSLMIARQDLVNVSNKLNEVPEEEKFKMFRNAKFMNWWIMAVARLIQHWYHIEENITSSVLPKEKEEEEKKV